MLETKTVDIYFESLNAYDSQKYHFKDVNLELLERGIFITNFSSNAEYFAIKCLQWKIDSIPVTIKFEQEKDSYFLGTIKYFYFETGGLLKIHLDWIKKVKGEILEPKAKIDSETIQLTENTVTSLNSSDMEQHPDTPSIGLQVAEEVQKLKRVTFKKAQEFSRRKGWDLQKIDGEQVKYGYYKTGYLVIDGERQQRWSKLEDFVDNCLILNRQIDGFMRRN